MCLAFKNDLSEFLIHIFVFIVEYLYFSTSPKSDLKIVKPVLTHDFYISILLIKSEYSIKNKIQMRQNEILT
ncbi:MAG: hypothetical protein DSY95_03520 [SAR324 cluster bacterium]|jgi:hypothetical protein|uniref:Uncharacterized protein n=1 Tax=SAR324 cluster bacterium TaxID=2024889 RepID=A0A432GSH4_9DELT|nr:MAG: hypothetical protein DSY95_03520 [SAR324 cluster bacterium]